jgi:predicted branched-subunit amino acid permease
MTDSMSAADSNASSPKNRTLAATLAILPLSISVTPWGILCGTLSIEAGLSGFQAQLMSLLIFAGAAQLSGIAIFGAGGSWITLINSTSMITAQHLLYSASYKAVIRSLPLYKRLLFAFVLTDELFLIAQTEQLKSNRFDYMFAVTAGLVFYVTWNIATFIGIVSARFLTDIETLGFDFTIAATFIVMVIPMIKNKALVIAVVMSAIAAYVFAYFEVGNGLIFSALIGMVVGAIFSNSKEDNVNDKRELTL